MLLGNGKEFEKPKDDDDRRALEVRRTVAGKEEDKLLDKLNKIESLQNKYDDRLRELTESAPSAATSASSTKKKPPPESDTDETIATAIDTEIEDIFDTFMNKMAHRCSCNIERRITSYICFKFYS